MLNNRLTFRVWTGKEMLYFKLGDNLPSNWSYWDTCMQNTSLKDKNGKEIYERDIARCYDKSGEKVYDREVDMFKFPRQEIWGEEENGLLKIEVIGNVFENKDLLISNSK